MHRNTKNSPRTVSIAQRRQQVANLYVQGWPQATIAHKLQIGQATVSRDLNRIREEWRDSTIRDFDTQCAIELQKLDRLEREAWSAWERSQQPTQQARITGSGDAQSAQRVITNQVGDPRFLDLVQKCIASRRALFGLDAPERPVVPEPPVRRLTEEERRIHILAIIEEAEQLQRAQGTIVDATAVLPAAPEQPQ